MIGQMAGGGVVHHAQGRPDAALHLGLQTRIQLPQLLRRDLQTGNIAAFKPEQREDPIMYRENAPNQTFKPPPPATAPPL